MQRSAEAPFTFPAVARLELDELLEQLIGRAQEVLRTQGRLRGLVRATQSIGANMDLPTLLGRIVEEARTLIGARYAALGVIGEDGSLTEFVHSGMEPATVEQIGALPSGHGLLGQLISHPQPLRLEALAEHASSAGFPPEHPPMGSFLGVPVRIRGQVFGNLYLTEKTDGEQFTAEDEELALSLATAAAAAIDNARLFDAANLREHWLTASRTVTNTLLNVDDQREALRLVTQAVRGASGADLAVLLVPDSDGTLVVAAADGPNSASIIGVTSPADCPGDRAVRTRAPVVVDDLSASEQMQGPVKALGIGPLAAVPLAAREQVLGALVLGNMPGHPVFRAEDLSLLDDFATQAALVLLVSAAQEVAKEAEMGEERARIARDLHDHAIQGIFSAGLSLNSVAVRVGGRDGARIEEVVGQLDDAITSIRRSIFTLQRPPSVDDPGLRARLSVMLDEVGRVLGFPPLLHTEGPLDSLVPPKVAHDLLAVVREALSNVARHAHATRVRVHVVASDDVTLEVLDNGVGLGGTSRASGLANMRDRAARHAGSCVVDDAPGGGTRVRWSAPLVHRDGRRAD